MVLGLELDVEMMNLGLVAISLYKVVLTDK